MSGLIAFSQDNYTFNVATETICRDPLVPPQDANARHPSACSVYKPIYWANPTKQARYAKFLAGAAYAGAALLVVVASFAIFTAFSPAFSFISSSPLVASLTLAGAAGTLALSIYVFNRAILHKNRYEQEIKTFKIKETATEKWASYLKQLYESDRETIDLTVNYSEKFLSRGRTSAKEGNSNKEWERQRIQEECRLNLISRIFMLNTEYNLHVNPKNMTKE